MFKPCERNYVLKRNPSDTAFLQKMGTVERYVVYSGIRHFKENTFWREILAIPTFYTKWVSWGTYETG